MGILHKFFPRSHQFKGFGFIGAAMIIIAALFFAGPQQGAVAAATPTFKQAKTNEVRSGTTNKVTFGSTNTAGNLIVVYVLWSNTNSVALSDSRGNTYAAASARTTWSGSWSAQTFYAKNIASGANTVTATFATSISSFGMVFAHEYSGVDKVNPLDGSSGAIGTGSAMNSGSVTTTNASDLLFAGGGSQGSITAAGSGYTFRTNVSGNRTMDKNVTAAGTYNATATQSSSAWVMQMVAFKADSGTTADTTPPSVPANLAAQVVSSTQINLSWTLSTDNVGVAGYKIFRDGTLLTTSTVTPFQNSGLTPGTTYSYTVSAFDAAGNESAQTAPVTATTPPLDTQPPAASMTAPTSGTTVSGTVTVSATATDNVGVAGVQFLLDGVNVGAEDTTAPYSISWDTTTTSNGLHSVSARARDTAGNFGASSGVVSVTVSNTAPAQSPGLMAGWNFNEGFGTTTADVSGNGNTATFQNDPAWAAGKYGSGIKFDGVHDFMSVLNSPTINITGSTITISAWINPAGGGDQVLFGKFWNAAMSAPYYQYGVELDGGLTPHFYIGTPSGLAGAAMGSAMPVGQWSHLAIVFDGTHAQFYLNGNLVSTPAMSASLTARDTLLYLGSDVSPTQFFNGTLDDFRIYKRTLNQTEVQNDMQTPLSGLTSDPTAPTVAITSPANSAQVGGMITISADADDDTGVAGVQFFVDGTAMGPEDTTSPYGANWDTRATTNGAHTITARARDISGNTAVSTPINVSVANSDYFQNEVLATGFNLPTAMKFLPDGRMLVAELQGKVKVLSPPYLTPDSTPFLQITNIGSVGVQEGIFDLALDPNFVNNHYFYVYYSAATPNRDRLSRFTANAPLTGTIAGSEVVLYQDPSDLASDEHHGGAINFSNDGKILFTTGEHFGGVIAQQLDNPFGKVHRINKDGTVPTDNPFYDGTGPNWDSIWAYGLRNPYRAFYDAPTDRLLIGDVGGNVNTSVEEVNLGKAGANYGWPNSEGPCSSPCTSPLYSYPHNSRDASVTGGFVYHGSQFPSSMQGNYFFGDYAQNWIRRIAFNADGTVSGVYNFEPADGSLDGPTGDVVYLTEGPDGALYYIDLGYSDTTGNFGISKVRRIRYLQANQAPIAVVSANPTSGPQPLNVTFSSAGSNDPEGQPLTYSWDFGDGTLSSEANPVHTYTLPGQYTVRLTLSDGVNTTYSTPVTISVGNAPVATIASPTDGSTFRAGDVISFNGDASDAEDGALPASAFTWTIDFLHDGHVHPGPVYSGVKSGTFTIPTNGHDFSGNTRYRIMLTVTDSNGLTDTKIVTIWPQKVNLSFDTVPTGLTLYLDGIAKTAPFTYDTLVGFTHTIEARNQTLNNTNYTFASWSDGGAQLHSIVVPATAQSYTATYTAAPLSSGLAAGWGFSEASGTTTSDTSGNNNTATLQNGLARATGKHGGGLSFDGTNDYLLVPNSSSLNISGNALTFSAWLNPSSVTGDKVVMGKFWNTTMTSPYYQYGLELSGGVPNFYVGTTSGLSGAGMGSALPVNQWSHLTIVFNGSQVQFYLNGTLVSTKAMTATITARGNVLNMGADASPGQFYAGLMDDVRIYNRVLTAAEVQTDMNTGL